LKLIKPLHHVQQVKAPAGLLSQNGKGDERQGNSRNCLRLMYGLGVVEKQLPVSLQKLVRRDEGE
jgi:hypothetical protein